MHSALLIDLLAAARCNMFSHVLVSYMLELKQFAQKTNTTFEAISMALKQNPKYDFCILKELTQNEGIPGNVNVNEPSAFDKDQSLFFAEDYMDNNESNESKNQSKELSTEFPDNKLIKICSNSDNIMDLYDKNQSIEEENKNSGVVNDRSSNLLSNILNTKLTTVLPTHSYNEQITEIGSKNYTLGSLQVDRNEEKNLKTNSWLELFADLDPLANLEAFDLKISGDFKNFQQT